MNLYEHSDPVNNIHPNVYAAKWLKKVAKGVKKAAKATYNLVIGDDIRTLTSKNTKWYQKAGAAVLIASNVVPGAGVAVQAAKVAVKSTAKAVKVTTTTAKKAAAVVNKTPKTVPAASIKSTKNLQPSPPVKASNATPPPKPKAAPSPQPARESPTLRVEQANLLVELDLQFFASKEASKSIGSLKPGSLSNVEARKWYLEQEAKIPNF